MDDQLLTLINQSPFLNMGDKSFLIEKLDKMSPLEKLKLKQSLMSGAAPTLLSQLQRLRSSFFEIENESNEPAKKEDILSQVTSKIFPQAEKKLVSLSILNQPAVLGAPSPTPEAVGALPAFDTLAQFQDPGHLGQLKPEHVTFNLNDNAEQILQAFLNKLDQTFDKIEDINKKRGYFINFMKSPLFSSYVNTGLTALRHPELQPPKIILNLLFQINPIYLNNKQFEYTSIISNHLRGLCGL